MANSPLEVLFRVLDIATQAIKPYTKLKILYDAFQTRRKAEAKSIGMDLEEDVKDEKKKNEVLYALKNEMPKEEKTSIFGKALNFVLSPNFVTALGVVGIGALAFSPLGPVFVGVAATLAVAGVAYEVGMRIHNYRVVKNRQEERALLEGIKSVNDELRDVIKDLKKRVPDLGKGIEAKQRPQAKDFDVSYARVVAKTTLGASTGTASLILANVIALNPVGLGIGIASRVLSFTGNVGTEIIYKNRLNTLNAHNENLSIEVTGKNTQKGRDNQSLLDKLNERKMQLEVLKLIRDKVNKEGVDLTTEQFKQIDKECRGKVEMQKVERERGKGSWLKDLKEIAVDGFSRAKSSVQTNPALPQYNATYKEKIAGAVMVNRDDIEKIISNGIGKSKQIEAETPQYHKHHAEDLKRVSAVSKNGAARGA